MKNCISIAFIFVLLCAFSNSFAEQWQITGPVPPRIVSTSPSDDEDNVALTREFIFEFSEPLDRDSILQNIAVTRGSEIVSYRVQVSPDNKRATIFWDDALPSSSRINVVIDGNEIQNVGGISLDANRDGAPGGVGEFQFDTLSLTTVPGTRVIGRVFASELMDDTKGNASLNRPLEGVRITVDGAESTMFTTTDDMGNFVLDPAPAGDFFVHVDGRTVTMDPDGNTTNFPDGPYYPFVGKNWSADAGVETNVGDVFLPLVEAGTLQPVSDTEDTVIGLAPSVVNEFPEFGDVQIMVPAGSLFANDGSTGGMVGISPVAPDRLPGALPPGLEFPLVITVQTDGATNFNVPAPVCFPNLPDAVTGELLAAGEKSALWSFDHDTGRFEVVGQATVSQDGMTICSDEGVGIREPGWHGINSGSDADGNDNDEDCEAGCQAATAFGAMDCAASFIPGGSCAFGVAYGAGATARDCVAGALTGDRVGCGLSGALNAGGAVAGCAAKSIPGLGSAIACGGALVGIFRGCRCGFKGGAADPDMPFEDAIDQIEANTELMQAYADFYAVLLGTDVWTNIVDYEASGDPREQGDLANAILEEIGNASDPASEMGSAISDNEFDVIDGLPKPDNIQTSDIQTTVDYINQSVTQWDLGNTTHAEAGRTDFMDVNDYLAAIDNIDAALMELDRLTGISSQATDFQALSLNTNAAIVTGLTDTTVPEPEASNLLFVLRDETNGTVLRGNLTGDNLFPIRVLRSDTYYTETILDPSNFNYSSRAFYSSEPGVTTDIPGGLLSSTEGFPDMDNDGLPDVGEDVVGTFVDDPDSDDDGILDGAEVQQGLDPLGGLNARTGIIASVDTEDIALDLDIFEDRLALADNLGGFLLYNIFSGMQPLLIGQLDEATRLVALEGDIGVSASFTDLRFIDLSTPSALEVFHEETLTANITKLVADSGLLYVLKADDSVSIYDMMTGSHILTRDTGTAPLDLVLEGDYIYLLTETRLKIFTPLTAGFVEISEIQPARPQNTNLAIALTVGDGIAWISDSTALQTIDVSNPLQPVLMASTQQIVDNFNDIELNGSGDLIAAGSLAGGTNHNVSLVDASDPNTIPISGFEFETPGNVNSLELSNGLAYAADGNSGLQVVNYESFDGNGVAPTVNLDASFPLSPTAEAEEGQRVRVTADVTDDVQVRNVVFRIDGQVVFDDGAFPFEYRFDTPLMADAQSFTVSTTAFDTGGNSTSTGDIEVSVLQDMSPPEVVLFSPAADNPLPDGLNVSLFATFSEPVDQTSLTADSFRLVDASSQPVSGVLNYRSNTNTAVLNFPGGLAPGSYTAEITTAVSDLAGNTVSNLLTFPVTISTAIDIEFIADSGLWSEPTNWSPMVVPRPGDRALLIADGVGSTIVDLDVDTIISGLVIGNDTRSIRLNAVEHMMTVNGLVDMKTLSAIVLTTSTLTGTGSVSLDGNLVVENSMVELPVSVQDSGIINVRGNSRFTHGITSTENVFIPLSILTTSSVNEANVIIEGNVDAPFSIEPQSPTHRVNLEVSGDISIPEGKLSLLSSDDPVSLDEPIITITSGLQSQGDILIETFGKWILPANTSNLLGGETNIVSYPYTFEFVQPSTILNNTGVMSITSPGEVIFSNGELTNSGEFRISGSATGDITNSGLFISTSIALDASNVEIDGDYTQTSAGTTRIRILSDLMTLETLNDQVSVTGTLNLDGKLELDNLAFQPLEVGNRFTLLTASSITGSFDTVEVINDENIQLGVNNTGTAIEVEVLSVE